MKLKKISETLLDKNTSHGELHNAAHELSEFFEQFSFISTKMSHYELADGATHTFLDSGIAISPLDAAICTNEYMRTAKYLRGVFEALQDILVKFQNQKIDILYAGCGPYGTLIIPLLSFFDSKRVGVTFLDIYQSSLESIQKIMRALELEEFVNGYQQVDAAKYQTATAPHMIITETMKAAFDNEPQVSITLNLLPQLHKEGVFIPQRVVVGLEAASYKQTEENGMITRNKEFDYLCDVIDMDTTLAIDKENFIVTREYVVSNELDEKMQMQLTTTIYVYKENILIESECSLNIPKKIEFERKPLKGDTLHFSYKFDNIPKIEYSLNNTAENFQGWIPQRVTYKYNEEQIVWYNMNSKRFIEPFFDDSFSLSSPKRYSSWKKLQSISKDIEEIKPSGFVFHTSRCGSTLLSQTLALFNENIVLSEAQLIHEALTVDAYKEFSKEEKIELLKDVIKVLGQKRFESEKRLFIKFDAWSIAELPLILEAYPDVPWVFLYRDPVEILVSQKRKRGFFTLPFTLKGKMFEQVSQTIPYDEYYKVIIAKIFQTALEYKDMKNGLFVNYEDIQNLFVKTIFNHFHIQLSEAEVEKIRQRVGFDAKDPKFSFKNDAKAKQNEADESIKSFSKEHILENYEALEAFREVSYV